MKNKAIILLSGGLDSTVALSYAQKHTDCDVELALTFDYGQKSAENEIKASEKIAEHYEVSHKIIELPWLRDITNSSLVSGEGIPNSDFMTSDSMKSVWIPNRNGLFLNIAASFCDSYGYNYIIFGANKEEGLTFPDNTEDFRGAINKTFEFSTLLKPKVLAPLINYNKNDIVKIAVRDAVPLEYIRSCYRLGEKHCGKCESCYHLKEALLANGCQKYVDILFENED